MGRSKKEIQEERREVEEKGLVLTACLSLFTGRITKESGRGGKRTVHFRKDLRVFPITVRLLANIAKTAMSGLSNPAMAKGIPSPL